MRCGSSRPGVQHDGAEGQRQAAQSARLLQAARRARRRGSRRPPDADNKVDIGLKFEEQNRNQLTFGAGVSQFDGFFGQLSFQTSNFLGRGETFSVTAQQGNRAQELSARLHRAVPLRPPDDGRRRLSTRARSATMGQFTQASLGRQPRLRLPGDADFARMFVNYSYEQVEVKDLNPLYSDRSCSRGNPFLEDSLLIGEGASGPSARSGRASSTTRSITRFFRPGKRLHAVDGLGGHRREHELHQSAGRGDQVFPVGAKRRTSLGFRAQANTQTVSAAPWRFPSSSGCSSVANTACAGSTSARSVRAIRSPGLVLGGNKSLLFNVEYLILLPARSGWCSSTTPVRCATPGQNFSWKEPVTADVSPGALIPTIRTTRIRFRSTRSCRPSRRRSGEIGEMSAFKTSTGAEIRFFMPVLNVPFRLIFAANPSRGGVLDNNLQPEKKWKFRFAVGSTF